MPTADLGQISLHYEATGPTDGETILLVMGLGTQMVYWPQRLIDDLSKDHRVVWFDNRDVGLSTKVDAPTSPMLRVLAGTFGVPVPPPPYTLRDMADDAVGLMDHLGLARAHVVGVSMGGMIAQRMAIHHPQRLASLVPVMSSSGTRLVPPAKPRAARTFFMTIPTHDRDAYIDAIAGMRGAIASPGFEPDPDHLRTAIGRAFDRGLNPAGFVRHLHAIAADGSRVPELQRVEVPTLVVHGADDPLVNHRAGRSIADAIPGAHFRLVRGMGHDLPPGVCDLLADEVNGLIKRLA
ncbi:alpha/beta fold hydrolase [Euzebya rosea]|uniref:alpha/beta fold hydrolase n=1 Tax=Euzebya rosea TaxID=2052804 RepID=UPI000D3E5DB2|nr:alpha/beta fold hydrolase [Euzebya rosea]